jgi:hypothetical protein
MALASTAEMTRTSLSALAPDFDDFLFALIGEGGNDLPLSVLSALARLDIDPWQEAAELARVSRETATHRLASLIASLPDGPSAHLDPGRIAARLIALLPKQSSSNISERGKLPDVDDVTKFRAGICMFAVFMVITLAAQWILANRQTSAEIGNPITPASSEVLPQPPPSSSGQ